MITLKNTVIDFSKSLMIKIYLINELISDIKLKIKESTNYIRAFIIVILIQMIIVYNDSYTRPLIKSISVIPVYYILFILISAIIKSTLDEIKLENNYKFDGENYIDYSIFEKELSLKREVATESLTCRILLILSFFYTFFWSV
jgi:hypothetical protein